MRHSHSHGVRPKSEVQHGWTRLDMLRKARRPEVDAQQVLQRLWSLQGQLQVIQRRLDSRRCQAVHACLTGNGLP